MTRSPIVTRDSMSATIALDTMAARGFRHLPVCNDEGDIVGLLDITKVFYEALVKLERAYASSQALYNALEGVQNEWGSGAVSNQEAMQQYIDSLREKMTLPELSACLDEGTVPCTVSVRTSVLDAARMMAEYQTTAVLVIDGGVPSGDVSGFGAGGNSPRLAGIFTSKDIVLRVIAAGLDPRTCSVVRVMTPHPDTAPPTMTIQTALRKMHDGHYLNLPVVQDGVGVIGVVDVLRLTWKTLDMIATMQEGTDEAAMDTSDGGPMWNRFWNGIGADTQTDFIQDGSLADTGSYLAGLPTDQSFEEEYDLPASPGGNLSSDVFPNDSASAVAAAQALAEVEGPMDSLTHDSTSKVGGVSDAFFGSVGLGSEGFVDRGSEYCLFKFTTPAKHVHRFQAPVDQLGTVRDAVERKLCGDEFFTEEHLGHWKPATKDFKLAYEDDEGDKITIMSNEDLVEAVRLARQFGRDRVTLLILGGPSWTASDIASFNVKDKASHRGSPAVPDAPGAISEKHLGPSRQASVLTPSAEDPRSNPLPPVSGWHHSVPKRKGKKHVSEPRKAGGSPKDLALPAAIGFLGVVVLVAVVLSRPTHNHTH